MQTQKVDQSKTQATSLWRTIPIGDEFEKTFENFKSSAFRLETLQTYAETSEAGPFHQYQRGAVPDASFMSEWCQMVREHVASSRAMRRIHIVDMPLSDYLKFEIECCYAHAGDAGEDIRIIDRSKLLPEHLKLINEDYWFFDSLTVMINDYDEHGTITQARITTDPVLVSKYAGIEKQLWPLSVPFRDFYRKQVGKEL